MEKIIDFNRNLFELSKEYPEIIEIMKNLGFSQIALPSMINTVGRFMTIPKGAASKRIDIQEVKKAFIDKGFVIKE